MAISLVPYVGPVHNYSCDHCILNWDDFNPLLKAQLSMEHWIKFLFVPQHCMKSFTFKSKTEKQWNKLFMIERQLYESKMFPSHFAGLSISLFPYFLILSNKMRQLTLLTDEKSVNRF